MLQPIYPIKVGYRSVVINAAGAVHCLVKCAVYDVALGDRRKRTISRAVAVEGCIARAVGIWVAVPLYTVAAPGQREKAPSPE